MATIKKTTYINTELEWAEAQLKSWKAYVDANPLHELKDRIEWKPTAKGGMLPMVIASIEAQGKFVQETMKNYLALVEVVSPDPSGLSENCVEAPVDICTSELEIPLGSCVIEVEIMRPSESAVCEVEEPSMVGAVVRIVPSG